MRIERFAALPCSHHREQQRVQVVPIYDSCPLQRCRSSVLLPVSHNGRVHSHFLALGSLDAGEPDQLGQRCEGGLLRLREGRRPAGVEAHHVIGVLFWIKEKSIKKELMLSALLKEFGPGLAGILIDLPEAGNAAINAIVGSRA
jgi:hypothetical protein